MPTKKMSRNKLILIISLSIGVLAIGIGIYFAWQKSQQTQSELLTAVTPEAATAVPSSVGGTVAVTSIKPSTGVISVLSNNQVFGYWLVAPNSSSTSAAKTIFYISPNGNIYTMSGDKEILINNFQGGSIQSVKASSDGKFILIKSGSFSGPRFDILDNAKNVWQPSLAGVYAADWSLTGEKLAYLQNNAVNKNFDLYIRDFNIVAPATSTSTKSTPAKQQKNSPQKIISLNQADFDLKWSRANDILFVPMPSIDYFSEIWDVNILSKTISRMTSGNSLMINWLKFSNLGLKFTSNNGRNYGLSLIDDQDNIRGSFKFNTLPDKCLLNSTIQIYCAIPNDQSIFSNFSFPDDYYKKNVYSKDGIYSVNLSKNQFQALFEKDSPVIDATNLSLLGNQLLFINRYDGKLYSLGL